MMPNERQRTVVWVYGTNDCLKVHIGSQVGEAGELVGDRSLLRQQGAA
jgi:hypothetical protein